MTDTATKGGATQPQPIRLAEEMASLLEESFSARSGFFRQGLTAVVCASGEPSADGKQVDLSVVISHRLLPAAATVLEAQAFGYELDVCLSLLHDPRPQVRASACQRLGHLGRDEASQPLQQLARGDGDECVREAATAALDSMGIDRPPADAFAGIELRLAQPWPGGAAELGITRTDHQGRARFSGVPSDACCLLQMTPSAHAGLAALDWKWFMDSLPHRLLCFDAANPAHGRMGDCDLEVVPRRNEDEGSFDAVLQLSTPNEGAPENLGWSLKPLARLGRHLYHANQSAGGAKWAVFERLPLGTYELLWRSDTSSSGQEHALSAKSALIPESARQPLGSYLPLVVHPSDRRLLATLEPDHAGSIVLTVATDSPELETAKVHYRLFGEQGTVQLTAVPGAGIWRGVRYLCQRFTPESALAVSLELL